MKYLNSSQTHDVQSIQAHSCDPPPTADQLPSKCLGTFILSSVLLFFENSLNQTIVSHKGAGVITPTLHLPVFHFIFLLSLSTNPSLLTLPSVLSLFFLCTRIPLTFFNLYAFNLIACFPLSN